MLMLLLVGLPLALVRLVGWPLPRRWPDQEQLAAWIAEPLTEQALAAAFALAAWLIWLLLVAAIVADALVRLRRTVRWLRRVPVPTPWQATATGLVGATMLTAASADLAPSATAHPPPPTGTPADHDSDRSPPSPAASVGVGLPDGGWLPYALAVQVASAAALVWFRRRRDYIPNTPHTQADGDLAPLPATVAAVQAALDPTDTDDPEDQPRQPALDVEVAGLGDLPTGLLHLTGPGATDAGRGLLIAAALASHDGPHTLMTTTADLATLLDTDPSSAGTWQNTNTLRVIDTIHDAPTALEQEGAGNSRQAVELAKRCLILLTRTSVDSDIADRLASAGLPGSSWTVVVLGEAPADGRAWQVAADGTTTDGRRLCVLGVSALRDLLSLARQAYPTSSDVRGPASPATAATPPAVETGRLRLRVLGRLEITCDGTPLVVRRSAAWQVLVLLAVHADGVPSERMARMIWPHHRSAVTTTRLYTTVSDLRGTLRAATGSGIIAREGDLYRLDPDHITVDLWELRCTLQAAARAVTPSARQQVLGAIVGRPPEPLAEGRPWPWLAAAREALRREVIDAHTTLAGACDPQTALVLLQEAINVDPLNEDLYRRTARALADTGQHTAIPTLIDTYADHLASVGLTISDDLRSLVASQTRTDVSDSL
ncbi:BTAD domain-containing putative transcriptional regulator [Polymorphospora lycopeni]|uniref:BTAD domain-containing putative transcriptional regulator n=1 Tax=Polymorphospora lycopeni TaxID=3140240 RepID=A0ABV5CNG7_9ACTN